MKKYYLLIPAAIGLLCFSFFSENNIGITTYHKSGIEGVDFSENPPPSRTGAPGEGNCTSCHSGIVNDADGVVNLAITGGPGYIPGASYPMTISSPDGAKNGFELVILDELDNQAGSFAAGPDTDVITAADRQYIRHSSSAGFTTWDFTWEAPAEDRGELTVYYAVVKANNNGSSSGDEVFLGSTALPIFGTNIEENELDQAFSVFYNTTNNQLNLDYQIIDDAKVFLTIQDLAGKKVQNFDLGNQKPGVYQEKLVVNNFDHSGIYVLSLFINNQVFNRKVFIG